MGTLRSRILVPLCCAGILACLLSAVTRAEVVIQPPARLPKRVDIRRGPVALHMRPSWSCCSVTTRKGRGISVVDPILYGLSAENGHLYWCDQGWARLKWHVVEQEPERDVLYVEGIFKSWRIQAWIAMYGDEEAAWVRRRTTLLRGEQRLDSARGVFATSQGKGGFEKAVVNVVVDGERNPLPHKVVKDYALFLWKDASMAVVNVGDESRKRGRKNVSFGAFRYYPENRFVEVSINAGSLQMKAGDFVENAFIMLWGDGDISDRVKAVLKNREKLVARLPAPERPAAVDKPAPVLPSWPKDKPAAVRACSFETPKGASQRVYVSGPPLKTPPLVDGALDDGAWKGEWVGRFTMLNAPDALSDIETTFQMRYDAKALYLAVRCEQPHLDAVKHARHEPERYVFGEQVELFFRVAKDIYQICVDPEGGWYDSKNEDVTFNLKWQVKVGRTPKGWDFEAAIPFAGFGIRGPDADESLQFNIARCAGRPDMPFAYSAWNPAGGQLASPRNLGRLFTGTEEEYLARERFFVEALLDREEYETLHTAAGAWVEIAATGGIPQNTTLLAGIADKSGKLVRASERAVTGVRGKVFLDIAGLPEGEYRAEFGLVAGQKQSPRWHVPFRIRKTNIEVKGKGRIPITLRSVHSSSRLPVCTGVAFPRGELNDASNVRLLDDHGQELPVHTSVLARWDPTGSVAWLRLNFQIAVEAGTPRALTLEYGTPSALAPPAIKVTESAKSFVVNTGPLQFTVPRTHGGVLESVLLDANGDGRFEKAEALLAGPAGVGPYLVDGMDKRYEAANDGTAQVIAEERGPLRVVFRVEGWYQAKDGKRLCKHVTRVTAHSGLPHLRLEHTWIMTAGTGEAVFKDIGFALPVTQRKRVAFGTDIGLFTDYTAYPRYLLQDDYLHYEISGPYRRTLVPDAKERAKLRHRAFVEGGRAPGWIAVKGDRGGMVLAADDFRQNFPKELGYDNGRVTFHVWPKHGRKRDRPVTDATLGKLDFVHSGETLDFKLPDAVAKHKTANKYEQGFVNGAARSNAIGIAKTHRLALTFFPASSLIPDVAEEAMAVADTPCAMAGPEWTTASGVFGPLHPRDPENFPEVEAALEQAGKIVPRLNHYDGYYGMWVYGQLHTDYNYLAHRWDIYRLFNQLHHNGPRWPWIMYFRSADPDYFDFALANTRILADVGFCHYSRPEFEKLPWPLGKKRGALTDYKGLVPWHSGSRNPDYNSLSAFLLWHYYMTGDGWTRDVVTMWGDLAKRRGPAGSRRSGSGTVRAAMDLYAATWDAGLIPIYRRSARSLMGTQLEHGAFPAWENYTPWLGDYGRFTGEAEAKKRVVKWADAYIEGWGDVGQQSGYGTYMNVLASAYFASGDVRYARESRGILETWMWGIHSDPESHLIGNFPGKYGREMSFFGNLLVRGPYVLEAWARAGKDISPLYPRSLYPAWRDKDGVHRIEVLVLDEGDAPLHLNLGGMVSGLDPEKQFPLRLALHAPDGAVVQQKDLVVRQRVNKAHGTPRAYPRDWDMIELPADGKKGVYRLRISSKGTAFQLRLPVSDHKEVYPLRPVREFVLHEKFNMASFYLPKGTKQPRLRFGLNHRVPATVQIRNPEFKVAKSVYLMGIYPGSRVADAVIPVPQDYKGGFWTVLCGVSPHINVQFTGDWRPTYFAVWPQRAFSPPDFGVGAESAK